MDKLLSGVDFPPEHIGDLSFGKQYLCKMCESAAWFNMLRSLPPQSTPASPSPLRRCRTTRDDRSPTRLLRHAKRGRQIPDALVVLSLKPPASVPNLVDERVGTVAAAGRMVLLGAHRSSPK
jgi:hypothetical protein